MDSVVKENLEKFLQNTSMWYGLVKNKLENTDDKGEILKFLLMQHSMNKSLLMDMGAIFKENDDIRELNEKVRMLENQLGTTSSITAEGIGRFVYAKGLELKDEFEALGMECNDSLSFSTVLEASLTIYPHRLVSTTLLNYRSEADRDLAVAQRNRAKELFRQNFDVSEEGHLSMLHSDRNMATIQSVYERVLGCEIRYPKTELGVEDGKVTIRNFKFSALLLEDHKNFARAMSRR